MKSTQLPGNILDLFCFQLLNAVPFCKSYAKLYFDAKHLENGLNSGVENFGPLFFLKNCTFWLISNAAQNF